MSVGCAPKNPSPVPGEGAERTRSVSEAGEGLGGAVRSGADGSYLPSPGRSLRARPPSPARGEGKRGTTVAPEMRRRARVLRQTMTDAERKLWYACAIGGSRTSNSAAKSQSDHSSPISSASKSDWSLKSTVGSTPNRNTIDGVIAGSLRIIFASCASGTTKCSRMCGAL